MPPKSNYYKRVTKKSSFKPRAGYKNNARLRAYKAKSATTMVSRGIAPLAQRYLSTLRYAERFTHTSPIVVGLPAVYMWNLNAINDPNRTGVGHQPYGHDTLSVLYQRYRVFAVSYKVTWEPNNINAGTVSVVPKNDDSSLAVDAGYSMEFPRSKTAQLSVTHPTTISGRISLPNLTGQTLAEYKGAERYAAVFGNAPSEIMTLQCYLTTQSASASLTANIELIYEFECFDPLQQVQS